MTAVVRLAEVIASGIVGPAFALTLADDDADDNDDDDDDDDDENRKLIREVETIGSEWPLLPTDPLNVHCTRHFHHYHLADTTCDLSTSAIFFQHFSAYVVFFATFAIKMP